MKGLGFLFCCLFFSLTLQALAQTAENCQFELPAGSYDSIFFEGSLKALQVGSYYSQERPRLIRQLERGGLNGEAFIETIELTSLKVFALETERQLEFFERAGRCLLMRGLLNQEEAQGLKALYKTFLEKDNAAALKAIRQFEGMALSPLARGMARDLKALYADNEDEIVGETHASVAKGVGYLAGAVVGAINNAVNDAVQIVSDTVSETTKAVTQAASDFAEGFEEGLNDSQDGGDDSGGGDSSGGGNDCGC